MTLSVTFGRVETRWRLVGEWCTQGSIRPSDTISGTPVPFTRTLALEVARNGVTANTLALGLMGLPDPDVTAALARSVPVGRTGTPEDVANRPTPVNPRSCSSRPLPSARRPPNPSALRCTAVPPVTRPTRATVDGSGETVSGGRQYRSGTNVWSPSGGRT